MVHLRCKSKIEGVNDMKTLKKVGKILLGVAIIIGLILLEMQYTRTSIDRCIQNGVEEQTCQELGK